jgi:predicted transglutaminase-like cysteine proteinase
MKNWMKVLLTIAGAAGMATAAPAQEAVPPAEPPAEGGMMGMGMMGMMKKCMEHCQAVREAASEENLQRLRKARDADDPAKIRAALDEAISALEQSRKHVKSCMKMMSDMHHGGSEQPDSGHGDHHGQQSSDSQHTD